MHLDLDIVNVSDLRWMPGASGLVDFDGVPASVPDHLIAIIEKQVDQFNADFGDRDANFLKGDSVRIEDGPFAGYSAIFDIHISGQDRVRVLLNLLQSRQMPIEIDSRKIRRVNRK